MIVQAQMSGGTLILVIAGISIFYALVTWGNNVMEANEQREADEHRDKMTNDLVYRDEQLDLVEKIRQREEREGEVIISILQWAFWISVIIGVICVVIFSNPAPLTPAGALLIGMMMNRR